MGKYQTPMMQQYEKIKLKYKNCLLFFRLGDFYELFGDDAKVGAEILNITLTSRDKGKDGKIPMAGVPYHAVEGYISKLVKAGHKVAICDQVSAPDSKGIVQREVVRVVTPGTLIDEITTSGKKNNFIVCLVTGKSEVGLAVADLSTGFFECGEVQGEMWQSKIIDELIKLRPSECLLGDNDYNDPEVLKLMAGVEGLNVFPVEEETVKNLSEAKKLLTDFFKLKSLKGLGVDNLGLGLMAAAKLLAYMMETQKRQVAHFNQLRAISWNEYLEMDRSTIINLELFSTLRETERKATLIGVLDRTTTSMGGRLLRQWLVRPLVDKHKINKRLNKVEELVANADLSLELVAKFRNIADMERIVSRLSLEIGNARDLMALKNSLQASLEVQFLLSKLKHNSSLVEGLCFDVQDLIELIDKMVVDEPPTDVKQGRMIKQGVNENLDDLRSKVGGGREWMKEFEQKEKKATGISSLKVKFNRVFGFYIEVSKSNLHLVPDHYIRKQTLVNAERFITSALKEWEELVLTVEEKINQVEYELFMGLVKKVMAETKKIQELSARMAEIDVINNFARIAIEHRYCRPEISEKNQLIIKNGRHPVVEMFLEDVDFVPNDTNLDNQANQLVVLTGPNMSGKSVYIRQNVIICLMAQMGCFVPADSAVVGIRDKLFVRSGAADVIAMGLSTFMVEMVETANILNNATDRSLVVMDEIGRGTSTYDGVSIAWSVAEYLVAGKHRPLTMFATHYHELLVLADQYVPVNNFQVAVEDETGEPVFLHKVVAGGASHSYGIAVAKMAGVPVDVIKRAREVLISLEGRETETPQFRMAVDSVKQLSFLKESEHPVLNELRNVDVNSMTPLDALSFLAELKEKMG